MNDQESMVRNLLHEKAEEAPHLFELPPRLSRRVSVRRSAMYLGSVVLIVALVSGGIVVGARLNRPQTVTTEPDEPEIVTFSQEVPATLGGETKGPLSCGEGGVSREHFDNSGAEPPGGGVPRIGADLFVRDYVHHFHPGRSLETFTYRITDEDQKVATVLGELNGEVKFAAILERVGDEWALGVVSFCVELISEDQEVPSGVWSDCSVEDLRASLARHAAGGAWSWQTIVIYNAGSVSCTVRGPEELELRNSTGRVVSRSHGKKPFMSSGNGTLGAFLIDSNTRPPELGSRLDARIAWTSVSQGDCPGGVFPSDGRLFLVLPRIGKIQVDNFNHSLPYLFRCDVAPSAYPSPNGPPELYVGWLTGTGATPFRARSSPVPTAT